MSDFRGTGGNPRELPIKPRIFIVMQESAVEATLAEAVKGVTEKRVNELARAIQLQPLEFVAVAALAGFVLALALSQDVG